MSFAFTGNPPDKDGAAVILTPARLRKSLNYEMLASGQAYALFYDTLFADLRAELMKAEVQARNAGRGIWTKDRTLTGIQASTIPQLENIGVVFPKLFRRLAEFFGGGGKQLSQFPAWVAATKERVLDLDTTNNTHFDTYIKVTNGKVKLTKSPDRLVFVSAKGKAPWL